MNCKRIRQELAAYLDNEVTAEKKAEISMHLAKCASCNQEKIILEQTWHLVGVMPAINPSPGFKPNFWEKVRELEEDKTVPVFSNFKEWLVSPVSMAASILAVWITGIGLGIFFFFNTPHASYQNQVTDYTSLGAAYIKRISAEVYK